MVWVEGSIRIGCFQKQARAFVYASCRTSSCLHMRLVCVWCFMGVDVYSVCCTVAEHLKNTVHHAEQMNKGGIGKRACYQGRCNGRPHQEEGRVDQSSPGPREVMRTPGCWSQMLSSLLPVLLLLLALVMAARMKYWDCVGRTKGTPPEEEVGVGQMTTLDRPVDRAMSLSLSDQACV